MLSVKEFQSIQQFYDYLCTTPFNSVYDTDSSRRSIHSSDKFTGTKSFDEAVELMRNGWTSMAHQLDAKLKVASKGTGMVTKRKQQLGVCGFQPIVPLYLAGVPTNMVSQVQTKVKSKVVSIVKPFNYNAGVTTETIIEESVKTLRVVKQLEAEGYRVNLSVAVGTAICGTSIVAKVRIKSANEKLNISKLAFPMVHPSMLRRLFIRYIEVCPDTTKHFRAAYGYPIDYKTMQTYFPKDIVLPSIWTTDVESITSLEGLVAAV